MPSRPRLVTSASETVLVTPALFDLSIRARVVLNDALADPPTAETTLSAGNDNRFAIVDEDLPVVTRSGIAAAGRLLE
jgi:hypothetical protein